MAMREDREREDPAARGRTLLARRLHVPNQSNQTRIAIVRPTDTQTRSCGGTTSARPVTTSPTRAPMAARIPMPASNIQSGKNAPKKTNEGAPRSAQPLTVAVANAISSAGRRAALRRKGGRVRCETRGP